MTTHHQTEWARIVEMLVASATRSNTSNPYDIGNFLPEMYEITLEGRRQFVHVHDIDRPPADRNVVYGLAIRNPAFGLGAWLDPWRYVYIGLSEQRLCDRMRGHHKLGAAKRLGATHVHVLHVPPWDLHRVEALCIQIAQPPLNETSGLPALASYLLR